MSERYGYGYGDDPGERDSTFSRQGAITDERDDQAGRIEADVDERRRGDEQDEEQVRADRIREAEAETRAAADRERVDGADAADSTPRSSVFDVEEEAARPGRTTAGESERSANGADRERSATGEPRAEGPAPDAEERPPIALGPPSRTTEGAATGMPPTEPGPEPAWPPAAATSDAAVVTPSERTSIFETADTAKPEAATPGTGTPTDETPAAVSAGVDGPESVPVGRSAPGTETERLVPGSRPAPVSAPADERSALLGWLDADAIRAHFLDIQAGFVDEPRQAVQEAERFVDELVQSLVRALEGERAKLKATIEDGSTEDLRIALRGYRAFVERLLNLTM